MATDNTMIAARYVHALFELASESGQHDEVKKDMEVLKSVLGESQILRTFLVNPLISRAQAEKAMESVLAGINAGELTRKFMALLARERRLAILPAAIDAYLEQLAQSRGEQTAYVTSAQALSDTQKNMLASALAKATGRKTQIRTSLNPALLGGIQVRIGSTMLDNSVSGKLARVRQALTKAA
jgi:F-type H+-transporting ATPase subunit delta